jgi:hypothetical protein
MKKKTSRLDVPRRDFLKAGAAAGLAAAAPGELFGGGPTLLIQKTVKPIVISSANGNRVKNGGLRTAVEKAFTMLTGGSGRSGVAHCRREHESNSIRKTTA